MVQHRVKVCAGRPERLYQCHLRLHRCGQPGVQTGSPRLAWANSAGAHGQHGSQLHQQIRIRTRHTRHPLARHEGVDVALPRGAGQRLRLPDRLGLLGEAGTGLGHYTLPLRCSPGLQRSQRRTGLGHFRCGHGARQHVVRPLRQQAVQVERPARLGAGARQALAPKRLHTHHGADHVAVDVHIARLRLPHHLLDGFINTGVQAQREAVAGGVDLLQQRAQVLAAVAHQVQHGAEDFALQFTQLVQLDQRGRHKGAARGHGIRSATGDAVHGAAPGL